MKDFWPQTMGKGKFFSDIGLPRLDEMPVGLALSARNFVRLEASSIVAEGDAGNALGPQSSTACALKGQAKTVIYLNSIFVKA